MRGKLTAILMFLLFAFLVVDSSVCSAARTQYVPLDSLGWPHCHHNINRLLKWRGESEWQLTTLEKLMPNGVDHRFRVMDEEGNIVENVAVYFTAILPPNYMDVPDNYKPMQFVCVTGVPQGGDPYEMVDNVSVPLTAALLSFLGADRDEASAIAKAGSQGACEKLIRRFGNFVNVSISFEDGSLANGQPGRIAIMRTVAYAPTY